MSNRIQRKSPIPLSTLEAELIEITFVFTETLKHSDCLGEMVQLNVRVIRLPINSDRDYKYRQNARNSTAR